MSDDFPASVDVEYDDGEGEDPSDYPSLQHKIEKAVEVTRRGLEEYDN
ncbi:nodulation protein, partial [Halorubrum sp. SD626R]